MTRPILISTLLACMTLLGFCSPIATADSDDGHVMFALGLGSGLSEVYGGGDSPATSHLPTGAGDVRVGYEFASGFILEGGIVGTSIVPAGGEQRTTHKIGERVGDGAALRVGHQFGRLRLLGGYTVGTLSEQRLQPDEGGPTRIRYDLSGPQISAGFAFYRTREMDLEVTGDWTSSTMSPHRSWEDYGAAVEGEPRSSHLVTQIYGLRMRLTPGRRSSSSSPGASLSDAPSQSSHSTSFYCFDCGRLFVDLIQIAPRLGVELVRGVATLAAGIH